MDEFTDLRRTITQLLLCHGVIEETLLMKNFQAHSSLVELAHMSNENNPFLTVKFLVYLGTYNPENFNKFMADISKKMASVGLSAMKGISEQDGKPYWTIVNFSEDGLADLGTEYTTSDLAVLKKAVRGNNIK